MASVDVNSPLFTGSSVAGKENSLSPVQFSDGDH